MVDSSNNDINNLLHDEDINKFVKSHIKEQAKSSAKHILGNLYNNIYNAPQPSTQPPQSHADEPTISIEKSTFDSYINYVVIKDMKGEGYEGIKTLLYANDIPEKEKKKRPLFKISVILYCWVEHIKTGNQSETKFQARVATLKKMIMLIVN